MSVFSAHIFGATLIELIFAAIGGLIIAKASTIHLLTRGKSTKMSSILNGILRLNKRQIHWKLSMFLGMLFISSIFYLLFNKNNIFFENAVQFKTGLSAFGFILSGFLVGFGTKLAGGCTSGHLITGLPQLSFPSLVAVITFLASAFASANFFYAFRYHLGFITSSSKFKELGEENTQNGLEPSHVFPTAVMLLSVILFILVAYLRNKYGVEEKKISKAMNIADSCISFVIGVLYGTGLIFGGIAKRHVVLNFFIFSSNWNPTLLVFFLCAILPNFGTFSIILKMAKPIIAKKFDMYKSKEITRSLWVGSAIFGVGWGLSGICPGPSFVLIPQFLVESIFFFFIPQCLGNGMASMFEVKKDEQLLDVK